MLDGGNKEHLKVLMYTNDGEVPTIKYNLLIFLKQSPYLVSPSMATLYIAAFVESCHWFISRSGLNLHEISPWVLTFWTGFFKEKKKKNKSRKNVIHQNVPGKLSFITYTYSVLF